MQVETTRTKARERRRPQWPIVWPAGLDEGSVSARRRRPHGGQGRPSAVSSHSQCCLLSGNRSREAVQRLSQSQAGRASPCRTTEQVPGAHCPRILTSETGLTLRLSLGSRERRPEVCVLDFLYTGREARPRRCTPHRLRTPRSERSVVA